MSLVLKLRRGEGPIFGPLKAALKAVLCFHLPVNVATRPLFRLLYGVHVFVRRAWISGRRFFWNEPLFRSQCEAVGERFQMEELPYVQGEGRIVIGDRVRLSGQPQFTFGRPSTPEDKPLLEIGDGTFIGHHCGINVGREVTIGRNCLLATGVLIYDQDGHPLDAAKRRSGEPTPQKDIHPVKLGDDVWIGVGSIILKGVTVGDRAVVAARSVVTKDVPADAVVSGNPARIISDQAR